MKLNLFIIHYFDFLAFNVCLYFLNSLFLKTKVIESFDDPPKHY